MLDSWMCFRAGGIESLLILSFFVVLWVLAKKVWAWQVIKSCALRGDTLVAFFIVGAVTLRW